MTSNQRLHVACCITEGYVMPLCGMLGSFFNHHQGIPVTLHILAEELTPDSRTMLKRFIHEHGAEYDHHTVPAGCFRDLQLLYAHFSKANFYRLLIPELIQATDRVLYLDVDILVRRPLTELYMTDLGPFAVGAVADAYPPADCKRMNIPEHLGYFNSGILIMDLPRWRRDRIAQRATKYLVDNNGDEQRCRYADQDGLNAVLQGQWKPLPEIWNFNIYYCTVDPQNLSEVRRNLLKEGPGIIHFADRKKPWMTEYVLPYQQEFLRAARQHGIRFKRNRTLRTLWPWFQQKRKLGKLKARLRHFAIPWHA